MDSHRKDQAQSDNTQTSSTSLERKELYRGNSKTIFLEDNEITYETNSNNVIRSATIENDSTKTKYLIKMPEDDYEMSSIFGLESCGVLEEKKNKRADRLYHPVSYTTANGLDIIVYPFVTGKTLDKYVKDLKGKSDALNKTVAILHDIIKTSVCISDFNDEFNKTASYFQKRGCIWDFNLSNFIIQESAGKIKVIFFDYHDMKTDPASAFSCLLCDAFENLCKKPIKIDNQDHNDKEIYFKKLSQIFNDDAFKDFSKEVKESLLKVMKEQKPWDMRLFKKLDTVFDDFIKSVKLDKSTFDDVGLFANTSSNTSLSQVSSDLTKKLSKPKSTGS